MLKSYTFVATDHQKLHNFVIAFFDRIEHEAGEFSLDFFDADFRPVVTRHRKVLKEAFAEIYDEVKDWQQADKSGLCEEIRQSNRIEQICSGHVNPKRLDETATGVYKKIRTLFLKLYSDVLDGVPLRETFRITLRQHFDDFRRANSAITLCPICGISELKTEHDTSRDQYDHYLPESLYPLSAVNFYNLVPTCKECNSLDVKSDKDVVAIRNTRLFFPYDQNQQGIEISFLILQDNPNIADIEWQVAFESRDGKDQEVEAWKQIYNIESRYLGFLKGRIKKWYDTFWEYLRDDELNGMTEEQKRRAYFASLKADEAECLGVIRKPALSEFLEVSQLERARQEAARYS